MKANAKSLSNVDRAFRGYIAVDDVQFKQMEESEETCKGKKCSALFTIELIDIFIRVLHF